MRCFENGLSAFTLKVLACVFMLIDHIGVLLLPEIHVLRVIGRLAFPLFAYFIAEGCRYTKNKIRRFLSVFILGVLCELAYLVFSGNFTGNILLTFSLSILLIYLLAYTKRVFLKNVRLGVFYSILFVLSLLAVYFFCEHFRLDYGFFGVLTPVLVVLFDDMGRWSEWIYTKVDRKIVSLFMLSIGLLLVALFEVSMKIQILSLFSLIFLALYNGQRGRYSFKYAFYLFYPLHLFVLEVTEIIVERVWAG